MGALSSTGSGLEESDIPFVSCTSLHFEAGFEIVVAGVLDLDCSDEDDMSF